MEKLSFMKKNVKNDNVVDILFDMIFLEKEFSAEMIRNYNIILANKLDNDILVERKKLDEANISKLNKNNSTLRSRTVGKVKCNNKEPVIPPVQKSLNFMLQPKNKNKHDGNKEINTLIKNNAPTNDTNDDNNKKTNDIFN